MWKHIAIVTSVSAVLLAGLILIFLMTPVMDEWALPFVLNRYCEHQKEAFSGEFFTPAYLCTFLDPDQE